MKQIIHSCLLIGLTIVVTSCSDQSISGHWKVQKIKLEDRIRDTTFTVDLTKPEQVKTDMFNLIIQEHWQEGHPMDSINMKADINAIVESYLKSGLSLKENNRFDMRSHGLIIPKAIPGWNFGDSLQGKWAKQNDTLILSVGDHEDVYTWKFRILETNRKEMRLKEIFENSEDHGNELWFVKQ
jgi:hypothetical protein